MCHFLLIYLYYWFEGFITHWKWLKIECIFWQEYFEEIVGQKTRRSIYSWFNIPQEFSFSFSLYIWVDLCESKIKLWLFLYSNMRCKLKFCALESGKLNIMQEYVFWSIVTDIALTQLWVVKTVFILNSILDVSIVNLREKIAPSIAL